MTILPIIGTMYEPSTAVPINDYEHQSNPFRQIQPLCVTLIYKNIVRVALLAWNPSTFSSGRKLTPPEHHRNHNSSSSKKASSIHYSPFEYNGKHLGLLKHSHSV